MTDDGSAAAARCGNRFGLTVAAGPALCRPELRVYGLSNGSLPSPRGLAFPYPPACS